MHREVSPAGLGAIYGVEAFPERKEPYRVVDRDVVENVDCCVIGSGAGGAIVATKLAAASKSVVLLERGGYYDGEDHNQRALSMLPLLWKASGTQFTEDLRIIIAQGRCLGGSTVINKAVCFRTPQIVRRQWREMGVDISDEEWDEATEEVWERISVSKITEEELNENNRMLRAGCEALRLTHHGPNYRNCINCIGCGMCDLGCHYETKQDMLVTYIREALHHPNSQIRIYTNCEARRITREGDTVTGVEGNFLDHEGKIVYRIRVNPRVVVVAAGAIASSQLLLLNGIAEDKAGRGLSLNPASFVIGDFDKKVKAHNGIPMAYTCNEFGVTNGVEEGGFLLESITLPLQIAAAVPLLALKHKNLINRLRWGFWFGRPPICIRLGTRDVQDIGRGIKLLIRLWRRRDHYAKAAVLIRDEASGLVTLAEDGEPRISYRLGPRDASHIARGMALLARMWFRLGANKVFTPHRDTIELNSEEDIPDMVLAVRQNPDRLMLGSAHPQGGNRMGEDPLTCVVDSRGRVHGLRNLFVADASVFPTSVGVNPQVTVMAVATLVAKHLEANWDLIAHPAPLRVPLS
ncbi:MAG: GMC family oxidoreductase N-terminal domain-containing protein [Candidatus Geothermarchaeales archaeon]